MRFFSKIINKITQWVTNLHNSVAQEQSKESLDVAIEDSIKEISRKAAREGVVLLKNEGTLPVKEQEVVSVFGRIQKDYFFTGYGSGGDVKVPYKVDLIEGLKNAGIKLNEDLLSTYTKWISKNPVDDGFWGHWPRSHAEMRLSDEIVLKAKEQSDVAIVCIGRSSGEDRENALEKGSFYLQDREIEMLQKVTENFNKVILLLNIGAVIDFSIFEEFNISAILVAWQGGMESGNAIGEIISGQVSPSGRLADTIARVYEDYPSSKDFGAKEFNNYVEDIYVGYRYFETFKKDRVLYPFGYGLSYTRFNHEFFNMQQTDNGCRFSIKVINVGAYKSKEVVQLYLEKPHTNLGNPARELVGYAKTHVIESGESQIVEIEVPNYYLASYDDIGKTAYKSAFVIEKGEYKFYLGGNVRDAKLIYTLNEEEDMLFRQATQVMAPKYMFNTICPKYDENNIILDSRDVAISETSLKGIIQNNLPKEIKQTNNNYTLQQVKDNEISLDDFIATLTIDELEAISRGDNTMNSPLGPLGNAGALGGVTQSLRDKGVIPLTTTDGPSGIRLMATSSLVPIGTLLACTFNDKLVQELYTEVGKEMNVRKTHILLAPGMNIHRNPLCGRNFEYFSEDVVLTGRMAAAVVNGIQSQHRAACPKHFAANSQEYNRTGNDSRISERALREIYLKAFEICVGLSDPLCIMTSYNKINGVWNHYNYELCQTILREEWGYENLVMTDWWMQYATSPEFPNVSDQAYRVRSRVNVFMPGAKRISKRKDKSLLKSYKNNGITLGEMQQTAKDVLTVVLKMM